MPLTGTRAPQYNMKVGAMKLRKILLFSLGVAVVVALVLGLKKNRA